MKAIVYRKYGPPEELHLCEMEKPVPGPDEILVKVQAASVNSWDWDLLTGKPKIYRLLFGLFNPKYPVIGMDIAGRVIAVGGEVKDFRPGDDVFGDISGSGFGAFAEYAIGKAAALARKPNSMTYTQAAAIPQAGVLALQGLHKNGNKIISGQKVLINGAGGGTGTFAIQIAKSLGAEVTGVDSADKFNLMRTLGTDHLIDYAKTDFTQSNTKYDFVLDMVFTRSVTQAAAILNPGGSYVVVGGDPRRLLSLALGRPFRKGIKRNVTILAHKPDRIDLEFLCKLYEKGSVKPVIEKVYPLENTADALRHLGEKKVRGKLVIQIAQ